MKTKILKINSSSGELFKDPGIIEGGQVLREGGLVAFPTETVYGLGANGLNSRAVEKIYIAKGRPSDNPLILHIAEFADLDKLITSFPHRAEALIQHFWPGPLTLVLQKNPLVPDKVTGGLDTVAIRMPSHPIARSLISAAGVPVAAPSANRSGRPSPTLARHVIEDLDGRVEMIIDGGPCQKGIESTVIDFSSEIPVLLRPGSIPLEELQNLLPDLILDMGVKDISKPEENITPKSPGMKYRHYSPEAELIIVEGDFSKVKDKIKELIKDQDKFMGLLATEEMVNALKGELPPVVKIIGSRNNPEEIASRLFRLLREFDEEKVELIIAEGIPLAGIGLAIMNRLRKAAGYHIIQV